MAHQEFEDSSYTALRKSLLRAKGSEQQKEFLEVLRSSEQYTAWMRKTVKIIPGEELPLLEDSLTESEFKEPPRSTERQIFQSWKSISPASACRVTFWGFMTLRHVEGGRIESSFLAANGGTLPSGLERIDRVLKEGGEKEIDGTVRAALRRLSGLPEARGNRSVYANCPLARAWWRRYVAHEVDEYTEHNAVARDVLKVLGNSQQYWEDLISLVVSRNSVLGDMKVRAALIWALSECVNAEEKKHLFKTEALKKARRLIGLRSAWQELGVFSVEELKELIKSWLK